MKQRSHIETVLKITNGHWSVLLYLPRKSERMYNICNVTRFGEILPLWQKLKCLWQFKKVLLEFGKNCYLLQQVLYSIGLMMKTLKAIWSHWIYALLHWEGTKFESIFYGVVVTSQLKGREFESSTYVGQTTYLGNHPSHFILNNSGNILLKLFKWHP